MRISDWRSDVCSSDLLLQAWKEAILREAQGTISQLQADSLREADLTDRASSETDWSIELRPRDRQRKPIAKIDAAIRRIAAGEYGYCEVTGEAISTARHERRPPPKMTVAPQERPIGRASGGAKRGRY